MIERKKERKKGKKERKKEGRKVVLYCVLKLTDYTTSFLE